MSRRVTRLALCAAVVGAVVGADLADQARELRSQAFQTGVYGGAPLDLDSPELDDDFEIVLMQPHVRLLPAARCTLDAEHTPLTFPLLYFRLDHAA